MVTALFCDVTGSTALGEGLDPEVLRGVINRYFADLRAAEDVINPIITYRVRARLALTGSDHAAAERWARRAAEIASLTDWPMTGG
jgi:hypothetical protein